MFASEKCKLKNISLAPKIQMKRGKKYTAALEKIEPNKKYNLEEAVSKLRKSLLQILTKRLN